MNWKKIVKVVAIIAAIALALFIICRLFNVDLSWKKSDQNKKSEKTDSTIVVSPINQSDEYLRGYKDGLKKCQECWDSLLYYKAKWEACAELNTPIIREGTTKPAPTKSVTKPGKPRVLKTPLPKIDDTPVAPEKFKPQPISGGKTASPISDDMADYLPAYTGDFGTTTSILKTGPEEAFLLYYLKNAAFKKSRGNASPPLINIGRGEDPMTYDSENDLWFFIDYNTPLTSEMITASPCYAFSVYIGEFKGANFSYKMYYPHELIKPILTKVRGKEDGEITKEELKAMGTYSSNIANGGFRPNGYFGYGSTPETAQTKYYGWEVCGQLNYVIKENQSLNQVKGIKRE